MTCMIQLMSYRVITKDNTFNGRTEAQVVVHLLQFTTQIVISLVKRLEVKIIKIDYQTVTILITPLITLYWFLVRIQQQH